MDLLILAGLIGGLAVLCKPKVRKFRCWLCRTETEIRGVAPGVYQTFCSYCELPCRLVVKGDESVVQATMGKVRGAP